MIISTSLKMKKQHQLTRFAPTPSGFLHLGNIYSFLTTHHIAQKENAKVFLRIDDLDKDRTRNNYINDIFETLDFLEIPYDRGPKNLKDFKSNFSQFSRLHLYREALESLKINKLIFACDCSRKKILKMNPKGFYTGFCRNRQLSFANTDTAWRVKTPRNNDVQLNDYSGITITGKLPGVLNDFIIRKKGGLPSYQLASLIDDIHFDVDLIVRGKDLYGSSLAQVFLSGHLIGNQFSGNTFYHHKILKNEKSQKLSKSTGSTSVQYLRKQGKKKAQVYQAVADLAGLKGQYNKLEDFSILVN